jgi:hypothetical protein
VNAKLKAKTAMALYNKFSFCNCNFFFIIS